MTLTASSLAATAFDLGPARALSCRECGHRIPLAPEFACPECFGPLEVAYEFVDVTRTSIEAGPRSIWRYRQLLPVPHDVQRHPNTEPGLTRLVKADRLAAALGLRSLWVKDDTGNPTHSFKDRVVAVALAAARELGFTTLACPSTGNLANAVAAAAARAGIRSVVLVPADLEQQKIVTTAVYGGTLVAVDGTYDDVNRVASELAGEHEDWAFVDVTDEEVVEGIRLLARTEGIFAETAGGVTVATLRKLLESGQIDPAAETVVLNTGEGLKTLDAVAPFVG